MSGRGAKKYQCHFSNGKIFRLRDLKVCPREAGIHRHVVLNQKLLVTIVFSIYFLLLDIHTPTHVGKGPANVHYITHSVKSFKFQWKHSLVSIKIYPLFLLKTPIFASFYDVHMANWLEVFPRNQIFIMRTEDFDKSKKQYLLQLFKFLNVGEYNFFS